MHRLERAERLVARLRGSPQAFPHSVGAIGCIETHISWVLLAGDYVYKLKKPLTLDFLDFGTLAQRHAACEEELRINRRTAPELYLAVRPITGTPEAPCVDGAGPVIEWAVQMRRFDQSDLASEALAQGRLAAAQIDPLAREVAALHAHAAVARPDQGWGQPQQVREVARQNLQTLQALAEGPEGEWLAQLSAWTETQGAALAPLLARRLADGWVREGHGDLHLGNIVLIDGRPRLFDAIEFNPAYRWVDVMADIAFLVMDLQARGRADLAWRLLNAYLERTGDYAGLQRLPYDLVYRALVRAKVAALRRGQLSGAAREAAGEDLRRYLRLAVQFTPLRPRGLWLTCGVSGSGKSSQTQALIEARGIVRLRSDVERKRLFGLAPEASSAALAQSIYTAEATRRTYERLAQLAETALAAGWPVLVDAAFLRRSERETFRALAARLNVAFLILAFEAPEAVLHERVRRRVQAGGDASEADEAVLSAQLAHREPLAVDEWPHALCIDTTAPVDWTALLPPG